MERLAKKKRITLLNVPLDIVTDDELDERVEAMLADGEKHQIVLLSLWDFMRARGGNDRAKAMRTSSLILTSSKMVAMGVKYIRHRNIPRYMPFDFVIRILTILEKRGRSVYLIGARPGSLQTASSNLRGSFPGLYIVGRCAGYFPTSHEENILLAIRKASPTLLLAGNGLPGKERWLLTHRKHFAPGLAMWCGDCLEVFAGKKQKTSRDLWTKGMDFLPEVARKPWRLHRGITYLWYLILLVIHRLRKL